MSFRKVLLMGSASALAITCSAVTASAQTAAAAPEEIVVTGIRASLAQSLASKKDNDDIVEVVSAEDIGKMPDINVADALQRIPGINTQGSASGGSGSFGENDRVAIRGSSPSWTQTTINGHSVASGDWFILDQYQVVGRSVSYTLLPAEMVSKIVVYKSSQADLVEGGVAGSVDIQTRHPLDVKTPFQAQITVGVSYDDLAAKYDPQFNATINWHNDAKTFGVSAIGFYEKRELRRDGMEMLGYTPLGAGTAFGKADPQYVGAFIPTAISSAYFTQTRTREGGMIDVQYKPNSELTFDLNAFYSHLAADNINVDLYLYPLTAVNAAVPTNVGVSTSGNIKTITSATFAQGSNNWWTDQLPRLGSYAGSDFVDGKIDWKPNSRVTVTAEGGVSHGVGKTPHEENYEGVNTMAGGYQLNGQSAATLITPGGTGFLNPNTSPVAWGYGWNWSDVLTEYDDEYYGKADVDYYVGEGVLDSVKAGVRYNSHSRVVNFNVDGGPNWATYGAGMGIAGPIGPVYTGGTVPGNYGGNLNNALLHLPLLGPASIAAWSAIHLNNSNVSRYYFPGYSNVDEKVWAGYTLATFRGGDWRGNAGVRIVSTQDTSLVDRTAGSCTAVGTCYLQSAVSTSSTDILPSVNISDEIAKNQYIKGSIAKTMSRPDYSSLGGAVNLNDQTYSGTGGNPKLKPVVSWNYDLDYEWYFAPQSIVSAGVFYYDLISAINTASVNENFYNQFYKEVTPYLLTSYTNTHGESKGAEFNYQQPLLHGVGINANYTYAVGKLTPGTPGANTQMLGGAKNTYNVGAYYEDKLVSLRVTYSYRSHYYISVDRGAPYNAADYGEFDGSFNVYITPNVTFSLDGLNLTDAKQIYYCYNTQQLDGLYDNGRTFYAYLRYKY